MEELVNQKAFENLLKRRIRKLKTDFKKAKEAKSVFDQIEFGTRLNEAEFILKQVKEGKLK
jgi:hypothetical protein